MCVIVPGDTNSRNTYFLGSLVRLCLSQQSRENVVPLWAWICVRSLHSIVFLCLSFIGRGVRPLTAGYCDIGGGIITPPPFQRFALIKLIVFSDTFSDHTPRHRNSNSKHTNNASYPWWIYSYVGGLLRGVSHIDHVYQRRIWRWTMRPCRPPPPSSSGWWT